MANRKRQKIKTACFSEKKHALKVFPREEKLKLKTSRQLNLAFAVIATACFGSSSESRIIS
jgi:hypothetical protein